ncbi:hypothetical protein CEXT_342771 [Caerostris extrusa]|uniref:Uncharacterized protein n=1 Tax=Caerostris extrusa TaxID=172846 RepID=A0AAV4PB00_CAEEX|nr:hypothetical protein CEXT_342771 [Caerostris extrusa]
MHTEGTSIKNAFPSFLQPITVIPTHRCVVLKSEYPQQNKIRSGDKCSPKLQSTLRWGKKSFSGNLFDRKFTEADRIHYLLRINRRADGIDPPVNVLRRSQLRRSSKITRISFFVLTFLSKAHRGRIFESNSDSYCLPHVVVPFPHPVRFKIVRNSLLLLKEGMMSAGVLGGSFLSTAVEANKIILISQPSPFFSPLLLPTIDLLPRPVYFLLIPRHPLLCGRRVDLSP